MPWQIAQGQMDPQDIFALQAVQKGKASEGQQQRALDFILRLTEHEKMTFYPGGDDGRRASDFAEGKRFIGSQIVRVLKMRPDTTGGYVPPT